MKGCLVVFLAFLALGLALPFLPDEEKGSQTGTVIVTIMSTLLFGFATIFTWVTLRKLPYADVVTDENGIWYSHLGKERGLIPWGKIAKVRERPYSQCLDLLDAQEERLLRVEYQLDSFEVLRDILSENVATKGPEFNRTTFAKGTIYHLFHFAGILGLSALGWYVASDGKPLLGYGAMSLIVAFMIYEYIVTATGIRIGDDSFEITYPLGKRVVQFSDLADIQIADEFHKGNRFPEVWVISKRSQRPFKLKKLGVDSNVLLAVLRNASSL